MSEQAPSGAVKAGQSYVEFFAVDGKLDKSLTKLGNRLKAFGTLSSTVGAALSAAAAGTATGMLAMAKNFADVGSEIDDASQKMGVGAKALSGLRYAAKMSGTEFGTVEAAIVGMSKTLYSFDEESKAAVKSLANLGIEAQYLKNKSPDQAFLTIADAISKIDDPTRRTALAMKVFGRSGAELLPMLSGGRAGIEDMIRAAEKLGITMTTADAQAAAQLGDAMDELSMAIGGVKNAVGLAVAVPLTEWANWFRDQIPQAATFIKQNKESVVSIGKTAATVAIAGSAATGLSVALTAMGMGLTQATAGFRFMVQYGTAFKAIGLAGVAYLIGVAIMKWSGAQEELNRQLKISNELSDELAKKDLGRTTEFIDSTKEQSLGDRRKALEDEMAAQQKALASNIKWKDYAQSQLDQASTTMNGIRDVMFGSGEMETGRQSVRDAQSRVESTRASIDAIKAELDSVKAAQDRQNQEADAAVKKQILDGATKWGTQVVTKGAGLFEAGKQHTQDLLDRKRAFDESLASDAGSLIEEQKTPAEKRKDRLRRLTEMKAAGKIDHQQFLTGEAQLGLEATQEKADKLSNRVNNRESLSVGVSEEQKNFLAMQAGKKSIEEESLRSAVASAKTLEEILAAQKRLNDYLSQNGISLVEYDS